MNSQEEDFSPYSDASIPLTSDSPTNSIFRGEQYRFRPSLEHRSYSAPNPDTVSPFIFQLQQQQPPPLIQQPSFEALSPFPVVARRNVRLGSFESVESAESSPEIMWKQVHQMIKETQQIAASVSKQPEKDITAVTEKDDAQPDLQKNSENVDNSQKEPENVNATDLQKNSESRSDESQIDFKNKKKQAVFSFRISFQIFTCQDVAICICICILCLCFLRVLLNSKHDPDLILY